MTDTPAPTFTCPECGGHYFDTDTSSESRADWTVNCNGSSAVPVVRSDPRAGCGWTGKHTEYVKPAPSAAFRALDKARDNALGLAAQEKWGHDFHIEHWECGCGYMNYDEKDHCGDCGTHKDHQ
jgi:hypothetical protein